MPSTSFQVSASEKRRIFIVENYWFHQRSCEKVHSAWRNARFPRSETPDNKEISRLVQKFSNCGSIKNLHKGIQQDTLVKVIGGFKRRLAAVIDQEGMHIERFHL